MKRICWLLVLAAFPTFAAPPYDVTATFTVGSGATSHRLYRGCRAGETKTLMGTVTSGQTFTGALTAAGEYSFCVHGVNASGEGPRSNIVVATVSEVPLPGAPSNLVITVTCPITTPTTCSVTTAVEP